MELRYYLSTLSRRKYLIFAVALITTLVSIAATLWWIPTQYKAGFFFTLSYRDDQPSEDYKYGNYHATMAAVEFGRTLSGWTKNPKLSDEVYLRAEVNQREDQGLLGKLLGPFSTKRVERANIQITMRSKTAQNAERLINALEAVLTEKLEEYNTLSATRYKINNPSKSFEEKKPKLGTNVPIGIIIGLLLGILVAYLYEYFAGVVTSIVEVEERIGKKKTETIARTDGPDKYTFLAATVTKHEAGAVIVAGVGFNPLRYSLRLTRALTKQADNVVLVDANLTKRNLHTFVKGHRKMNRGHTDNKSSGGIQKIIHPVPGEQFSIVPAGKGGRLNADVLSEIVAAKGVHIIHTQLPQHADVLTAVHSAVIMPIVQLGRTKADDVEKLRTFFAGRDIHLVIIK